MTPAAIVEILNVGLHKGAGREWDGLLASPYRVVGIGGGDWRVVWLHTDHLGSTRMTSTTGPEVLSYHTYEPFGWEIPTSVDDSTNTHQFTGHERDAETGLDYMLARYHANNLGRFLSVDPVDGNPLNPQSWNLYAYVANNPMLFVDPTGETLTITGSQSAQDKFKATADSGLQGQEVQIDSSGTTTLADNGVQGPPTAEQAALADNLSAVIGDSANTSISVSEGSGTVIGNYASGDLDMNDIQALGSGPGVTAVGALAHEVVEQFAKQVGGQPQGTETKGAHAFGIAAENAVNGSIRGPQKRTRLRPDAAGGLNGKIKIPYSNGMSKIKIRSSNVVSVKNKQ